jgi:hypothetical protein
MSIIHRLVIISSILFAAVVWFLLRGMPEVGTAQTILFMVLPGAAAATAFYSVCMVFSCMGGR